MLGDPGDGRQSSSGSIQTIWEPLFENDSHEARHKTLHEIQHVIYGRAYLSDGLEDVAVEYHLPLDASFWSEEGSGMEG